MTQLALDVQAGLCPYQVSGFGRKVRLCGQPITHRAWWTADDGWAADAAEDENSGPIDGHVDACQAHASQMADEWYAHFFYGGADRRGDEYVNPTVAMQPLP